MTWRPFEEAREFARSLGLKNTREWREWCKSDARPKDIPRSPYTVYPEWVGMGDWLGTDFIDRRKLTDEFLPFQEARSFVRTLGLKNTRQWNAWSKSSARPWNIPSHPRKSYPDLWRGMPDWLGTFPVEDEDDRMSSYMRELSLTDITNLGEVKRFMVLHSLNGAQIVVGLAQDGDQCWFAVSAFPYLVGLGCDTNEALKSWWQEFGGMHHRVAKLGAQPLGWRTKMEARVWELWEGAEPTEEYDQRLLTPKGRVEMFSKWLSGELSAPKVS